jgi:starch-binding outer membrane protein, SusD/RagB family
MKKVIYILTIVLLTGTVSCKKFLEEENPSGLTSETYYVDATGFEALVNASYQSLRTVYNTNPSLFEWGTDIITRGSKELLNGGADLVPGTQLNEYKLLGSNNIDVRDFFTRLYAGIQRCNTGINRASSISGLTESLKSRRVSELRFIRAYYYYLLVENFGRVPIVQEEFANPVTHFVPNTEQEVYTFILAELNAALPNLEADPTKVEPGRATQGAAKHLLSLLYLTRGYKSFGSTADFTESARLAEELISSPSYALLPSFADVFKTANEASKEIIFSIQYTSLPGGAGHGQNIQFGWRIWQTSTGFDEASAAVTYNKRRSDFVPTPFLYSLFDTQKDSRYDATFLSEYRATRDQGTVKKGDLRFYFPYPDQPFTTAQENTLKAANPQVQVIRYPWTYVYNEEKFPMINKFYDPVAALPGSAETLHASTKDIIIFRLAETYLIAAEAYVKLSQPGKAADKLNILRARAAKPGQSLAIGGGDVTLDFILDERAREQAGEYKRWLDLKRTHRLDRAFMHNPLTKAENGTTVDEKFYLRPIPQSVRDRDTGGYPQNDGY